MRSLTICLAYYDNPGMLELQLASLAQLPKEIRDDLRLVVVDDASPRWPAEPVMRRARGVLFKLFRMLQDIPWNQDACRNLAVSHAATDWVLLTDMDHMPSEDLLRVAMSKSLDEETAYSFRRVTAPEMTPYKAHPNSWLMTRTLYDRTGGYDERMAGVYGTDGMFKAHLQATARNLVELKEALIRYPREVVADASTTTLQRKGPENDALRARLKAEIAASGDRRPVRGRFEWERVI